MEPNDEHEDNEETDDRGLWERVVAEVRSRPKAYALMAAFIVTGPFLTSFLFPEAPLGVHIVGGGAFGIYAAVSAIPQKFF